MPVPEDIITLLIFLAMACACLLGLRRWPIALIGGAIMSIFLWRFHG